MLNNAVIMGRLVNNPELRSTGNGVSVTTFTVAVDRRFDKEKTDFIDVIAWRQQAEFICKYFAKGTMIAVQGSIQTRTYEDKNGNKRKAVEIVADNASFCGGKNETNAASSPRSVDVAPPSDEEYRDIPEGDLPF